MQNPFTPRPDPQKALEIHMHPFDPSLVKKKDVHMLAHSCTHTDTCVKPCEESILTAMGAVNQLAPTMIYSTKKQ